MPRRPTLVASKASKNDILILNSHYWMTDFFDGKLALAPIGDSPQVDAKP